MQRNELFSYGLTLAGAGMGWLVGGPIGALACLVSGVALLAIYHGRDTTVETPNIVPHITVAKTIQQPTLLLSHGFAHAELEIRFEEKPPYCFQERHLTTYRMGIYNRGPHTALNVDLLLVKIEPQPRTVSSLILSDYPYPVRRGCTVNVGQEELFDLLCFWGHTGIKPEDERLMVSGINTKTRYRRQEDTFMFRAEDRWCLEYQITSAVSEPQEVKFIAYVQGGKLLLEREFNT